MNDYERDDVIITLVQRGTCNSLVKLHQGSYFPEELERWGSWIAESGCAHVNIHGSKTKHSSPGGWRRGYVDSHGIVGRPLWFLMTNEAADLWLTRKNEYGEIAP